MPTLDGVQLIHRSNFVPALLALVVLLAQASYAISHVAPAQPFDVYGNLCWEDEQFRLTTFAGELKKFPAMLGTVIVYAGRHSCSGEARYRAERAGKWLRKQGIAFSRVIVRDGGYRENVETLLYVNSPESPEPAPEPKLKKEEVSVRGHCVDKTFARVICLAHQN